MNLEALGNLGDFVGGIAVMATLIYLAFQIRQNTTSVNQSNRIAIANAENAVRTGYSAMNLVVAENAELAELLVMSKSTENNLSEIDLLRLRSWLTQLANQWQAMETAYRNNMIPAHTYDTIFDDHRFFIATYPAIRPLLRDMVNAYPALTNTAVFKSVTDILEEHDS